MYSRSFYPESSEQNLPQNYVGTAFSEPAHTEQLAEEETAQAVTEAVSTPPHTPTSGLLSSASKLPFLSGILGENGRFRMPKIGSEEILIIAIAALLFFSKNGDKECALILLGLLFIG